MNKSNTIAKSLENFYLNRSFEDASKLLLKHKDSYSKGQFHFNFGTLQLKLNNLPAAKFHLNKAISNGNYNSKTINNLKYVNSKLNLSDINNSTNFYDNSIHYLLQTPTSLYLSITLGLILLSMILLKKKIVGTLVFISIFLVALIPYTFSKTYLKKIHVAISLENANLHEGPSKIYSKVSSIPAGTKIIINKTHNSWVYILRPLPFNGWIKRDKIGIL